MSGFAQFGLGVQGLTQGIVNGMQLRDQIDQSRDRQELRQAAQQGVQVSRDNHTKSIADNIQLGGIDAAGNQQYAVGGKTYSDFGSAQKAAKRAAPDFYEIYNQVGAPRMRDTLLAQGKADQAQVWDNWISHNNVQSGIKNWTKAVQLASSGDQAGAANALVKAYNNNDYFADGTSVDSYSTTKDEKGNITGFDFSFKQPDGSIVKKSFAGADDFLHQGIAMLAPEQTFKYGLSQLEAQKKAASERQSEVLKANLKVEGDKAIEAVKHKNRMEEDKANNAASRDRTIIGTEGRGGGNGAGGKNDLSAAGKTIRDLEAVGVPRPKAIALATNSRINPATMRAELYKAIKEGDIGNKLTDEDIDSRLEEAYKLINRIDDEEALSTQRGSEDGADPLGIRQ